MSPRAPGDHCRNIVVADEDKAVAGLVIETLLDDGHAVFQAHDGLSAFQLAFGLKICDLVISNSRVGGEDGIDLIHELRERLPKLPILFLANHGRSAAEVAVLLPAGVPILCEPFTVAELQEAVRTLLL
jgi:two-component system, response regulator FlrC